MIKDHNVVLEDYTLFHYTQYIIKQGILCMAVTCNDLVVEMLVSTTSEFGVGVNSWGP